MGPADRTKFQNNTNRGLQYLSIARADLTHALDASDPQYLELVDAYDQAVDALITSIGRINTRFGSPPAV